jgi:hypothetical protein
MNSFLIYPAIIVFSLLTVALVLTFLEFKDVQKKDDDSDSSSEK